MPLVYHNIIPIFVFIFGSVIGSFLNVCIYRLPLGKSIVSPPSHCPKCKAKVKAYDNLPILSYIILRGKCRSCGEPFSVRYPAVEFVSGLFCLFTYLKFSLTPAFFIYYIFICSLIVISFIDIDHYIIPDVISIPMLIIGLITSFFNKQLGLIVTFKSALFGAGAGAGFLLLVAALYYLLRKKEGMGMGDVKLLAMFGSFLGLKSIFFIVFASSLFGAAYGIPYTMIKKKGPQHMIPFGPFLCAAAVLYLFYGEAIISFYLNLVYS